MPSVRPPASVTGLRVLCVDEQQTFADAMRIAISAQPDLACVGTAGTVEDAIALAARTRPHVVLMGVSLPGGADGIEGTTRMKAAAPSTRVVILTALATADLVARAAAAGADAFLTKDAPLDTVLEQLRSPSSGRMVLQASVADGLRARGADRRRPPVRLTRREAEVLAHLADGVSVPAMAPMLGISVHTCREYARSVLVKLGAHSQLEAVAKARRLGVVADRRKPRSTPQG